MMPICVVNVLRGDVRSFQRSQGDFVNIFSNYPGENSRPNYLLLLTKSLWCNWIFQLTSQSVQGEQIILKISFDHCKLPWGYYWPLMRIWVFGTMEINYMNKSESPPHHRDWELGREREKMKILLGTVEMGNFGKVSCDCVYMGQTFGFVKQQNSPVN